MMDAVTNAFLIIVFVWKFAPAIINPVWAIRSPLQALLAIGSMKHIIVGCIIACIHCLESKRSNFLRILLDALPIGFCMSIIFIFYSTTK